MLDMTAPCIDVHCYHGKWSFPIIELTTTDVLALMERAHVEKAILMSARAIQYDLVGGNAELAAAIAPHPGLYGYVYINMHYPEASLAEMEKYLWSDKFVGVKYHGEYSRANAAAPENREAFDRLEKVYRKPLLIHSWGLPEHGNVTAYSLPSQILELACAHPSLKIVMGHMGGTVWMDGIRAAEQAPNLYLDTTASYADQDKVAAAVRALGAEKVLFGSGATEGSLFMQKAAILDADITDDEKHTVLYGAAQQVFDL
jgi:predicted TIM-barrel fold metal-dependent hydrolase